VSQVSESPITKNTIWNSCRCRLRAAHKGAFRDDKSGGFDLEASHLTNPKRLDTLLLALSVALLWVYELGEQVLRDGHRSEVNPAYKRQLSVFQLRWRLISYSETKVIICAVRRF
jgi:hypothetical protein